MKATPDREGIYFEFSETDTEETIQDNGVPGIEIYVEEGMEKAALGCLAMLAGLKGRFIFESTHLGDGTQTGFELTDVSEGVEKMEEVIKLNLIEEEVVPSNTSTEDVATHRLAAHC